MKEAGIFRDKLIKVLTRKKRRANPLGEAQDKLLVYVAQTCPGPSYIPPGGGAL